MAARRCPAGRGKTCHRTGERKVKGMARLVILYEYEVLCRLRVVLPDGVKVTVVADWGFADGKLFYALTTELGFEYVIRLRGDVYVTNARGERRVAAEWIGARGRARRLVGARVTDVHEWQVGAVVCVHDEKMDEPWCLVASEATVPTRVLIRYYGKRWGIEAGFRDIKDMRFGMGLSSMHVSRPERRDRLLLIRALAIAVLSVLGAAGERIGYDRWLKANTVKRRTHSLFRQGLILYHHLPNWPEDRIRPLMQTFGKMLLEQRVYREVFGVIRRPAVMRGCMRYNPPDGRPVQEGKPMFRSSVPAQSDLLFLRRPAVGPAPAQGQRVVRTIVNSLLAPRR